MIEKAPVILSRIESAALGPSRPAEDSRPYQRMHDSLTFGQNKRVKRSEEFAQVKTEGRRLAKGSLLANWAEIVGPQGQALRLGVVTSKSIGGSTDRSRARRLIREAFRLNQGKLRQPLTLVLVARQSIVGKGLADVERDFLNLMRQARLLQE